MSKRTQEKNKAKEKISTAKKGKLFDKDKQNGTASLRQNQNKHSTMSGNPTAAAAARRDVTASTTAAAASNSWKWGSPMATSFFVVFILFLVTLLLAAINFYIWYMEKRRRRRRKAVYTDGAPVRRMTSASMTSASGIRRKSTATNVAFILLNKPRDGANIV